MYIPLIDLQMQYKGIEDELKAAIHSVLASSNYIMGNEVINLEDKMSKYLGVKHCISVASGTDALVIALNSLGIGKGDEVITSPFTFFATAESISSLGATPVFVDVKENTFNIDPTKIEEKITSRTRAIIVVHIFGQPAEMIDIIEIAKKHNLKIIEDACQAFGAEYFGKKIGSFGDIACFSFFPTKNLGCAGDGGMIATNDYSISIICRALRSHGSGKFGLQAYEILSELKNCNLDKEITILDDSGSKYYNFLVGYNSRLDTIQAAILLVKLNYIDLWNNMRAEHAAYYNYNLKDSNFILPKVPLGCKHVYHMYVIQSTNRDKLIQHLNEIGISAGVYYPVPLHLQKVYRILGYNVGDNPISELLAKRTLAIPIYPELTKNQLDYIVNALLSFK